MLESFTFWILVATALSVFAKGLAYRAGYMTFPTLFSGVCLGWVIPQLWGIRQEAVSDLTHSLTTLHLFSTLCLIATVLGWRWGLGTPPSPPRRGIPRDQLLLATAFLTLLSWASSHAIGFVETNTRGTLNWSGPATILYFVSSVGVLSLFLSLYLVLTERTRATVALAVINVALYAEPVLLAFRRAGMAEAFVCAITALWFARRRLIPRGVFLAAVAFGMFAVFAVGALRSAASDGGLTLSDLGAIDFWATTPLGADPSRTRTHELLNALHLVRAAEYLDSMTLGAETWNQFVFQWVPGQIVGHDLKAFLTIETGIGQALRERFNYSFHTGTTPTGLGPAYVEFRYLGAVPFGLVAFILGRWWKGASRGDVRLAVLYAAGLTPAMHTITHYTLYFFNHMALLVPALFVSLFVARQAMPLLAPRPFACRTVRPAWKGRRSLGSTRPVTRASPRASGLPLQRVTTGAGFGSPMRPAAPAAAFPEKLMPEEIPDPVGGSR